MMSIKYQIIPSKLIGNPDGFAARVQSRRTVEIEEIAAEIARLGTTVSKEDALNVLNHYHNVVARTLLKGETVNTPAVHYRVSLRGTFAHQGDSFDPSRHQLTIRLSAGPLLHRALRDAQVEKHLAVKVEPRPLCYVDTYSGEENGPLSPGEMGRLIGKHLRFDPGDPEQGIFFLHEGGGETRVPSVGLNMPAHLAFIVPALPAGSYRLQVRVLFEGEDRPRSGELEETLTVI
jgi:hypothetical protein